MFALILKVEKVSDTDVYIYNGNLERGNDFKFITLINEKIEHDRCLLFLVTRGGNPDAAFKIARYLQYRYKTVQIAVTGLCKSAGTLLALGAHEILFSPYGELGPLDIQLSKVDQISQMESGLNISEAFFTLEDRAKDTYHSLISDIISSSGGVISFPTASHSATEIISALYGPIFHRIDPEEVGSRARAMRIGADYGKRLDMISQNLKPGTLEFLSDSYSSHGFVIDFIEASGLFKNTRLLNEQEMVLVDSLSEKVRHPLPELSAAKIGSLDSTQGMENEKARSKKSDGSPKRDRTNGRASSEAVGD